jgi:hypothetical protein
VSQLSANQLRLSSPRVLVKSNNLFLKKVCFSLGGSTSILVLGGDGGPMAGFQLFHSFGGGAKGLSVWLLLFFFMKVGVHSLRKIKPSTL